MAMEPQTGNIKAWLEVSITNTFDHVGQGARQVGSTFKPYATNRAVKHVSLRLDH
jgi:penicillin-binding protein 1A